MFVVVYVSVYVCFVCDSIGVVVWFMCVFLCVRMFLTCLCVLFVMYGVMLYGVRVRFIVCCGLCVCAADAD